MFSVSDPCLIFLHLGLATMSGVALVPALASSCPSMSLIASDQIGELHQGAAGLHRASPTDLPK
jgi:hypothetical protein